MQELFYMLPEGVHEKAQEAWETRPVLPPGLTYNVRRGPRDLFWRVVVGTPNDMAASVVGTCAFGVPGTDIDFGVEGDARSDAGWFQTAGSRIVTMTYTGRNVIVHSEYLEVGEYSYMAIPTWRMLHDAKEYARAAALIYSHIGLDQWLAAKKVDKVGAYKSVGITCKAADGTYAL